MKVHYINKLLFALPLNILAHNNNNKPQTTTHDTITTRLLCECELYAPANYDNDSQMKSVMEHFNKQTQQRLHEYEDRMKEKRKQCKDKCDKEIQKIILKDKLEKELMDKFATLHTDIQSDAIPTCICEKSIADKTEKFCLNCGKNMGAIAPWWGLVCGAGYAGWTNYVATTVTKAGMDAGMGVVNYVLKELGAEKLMPVICKKIYSIKDFSKVTTFAGIIRKELEATCATNHMCLSAKNGPQGASAVEALVKGASDLIVKKAPQAAKEKALEVAGNYASTTGSLTTGIPASILAIEIIVLIMMIIYWILRYRRKKKMKKKLQYMKLLEE
ncbi:rifin PIR protein,putative [Plasmodium sp. DRC-Itaito]|nr:rifin PIR protein,putative [Plasmodium sp. DRC-Itaito]